jgi:tRNA-binding EMAP/Myf-like protein
MGHYRAYFIDADDLIVTAKVIQASDDEEAVALMRCKADDHDIELWSSDRKIVRLKKSTTRRMIEG